MALHKQVDVSQAEREVDINPVYVQEKGLQTPRYRMPDNGMLPSTAAQVVRDELILDGNARLNLATFVTTWMEPEAEKLMAVLLRQEHDRQGRVPADRRDRAALREHPGPPVALTGRRERGRVLDHRLQRGVHAGRDGAAVALAQGPPGRRPGRVAGPTW